MTASHDTSLLLLPPPPLDDCGVSGQAQRKPPGTSRQRWVHGLFWQGFDNDLLYRYSLKTVSHQTNQIVEIMKNMKTELKDARLML